MSAVAIVNPLFLVAFVGAGLFLGVAAILELRAGNARRAMWLGAASLSYVVGVFGVTVAGNVPPNDELASFQLAGAVPSAVTAARSAYEGPWNRLHLIRSVINVLALTFAGVGAVIPAAD